MSTLLLSGGVGADGSRVDVRVDPGSGVIAEVGGALAGRPGEEVVACEGMVVLPAPAEPHAHLDKALSAQAAPNPAGDLAGAITAWMAYRPQLTHEDMARRAHTAALELVAHGTTAVRTHVDVGPGIELRAVEAVCGLRDQLAGLLDLQVVALAKPLSGPDGALGRRLLDQALDAGADVAGGCPHLEEDPAAATRAVLDRAEAHGVPVDLHTDEQLQSTVLHVEVLIEEVSDRGFEHGVTASHCVSLGVLAPADQQRLAVALAAAGIAVVALPQTNLYLQARDRPTAPPRGLTALRALLDAGATLAAGADNVRDPFCSMGRSDPLETAALLVMAGHLSPQEAYAAVSDGARAAMGLPPVELRAGAPAELLAVRGFDLPDALARASEHRTVVHRGHVVARTAFETHLTPVDVPLLTT